MESIVIMGVAGCGKSSLATVVARATGLPLVEGDDHHSAASLAKMRCGQPLTDADRAGWLSALAGELSAAPKGLVLTCSALKRAYRDRLRAACTGLRFVFMDISRDDAHARVTARSPQHFFSVTLIDSQFATLEPPHDEPGVLRVNALAPLEQLQAQVTGWIQQKVTP